jgi:hypothetical protein
VHQHVRTLTSPTTHGSTVEPSQNFHHHQQKTPRSVQEGLYRAARRLARSCGLHSRGIQFYMLFASYGPTPIRHKPLSKWLPYIPTLKIALKKLCRCTKIWRIPRISHSEKTANQDLQCIHHNLLPVQSEWLSAYIKVNSIAINYSLGQK